MIVHWKSASAAAAYFPRLLVVAGALVGCETTPTEQVAPPAPPQSLSSAPNAVDPGSLTPNPVEFSSPSTAWECRRAGDGVRCTGHFTEALDGQENGIDCGGRPIIIVDGEFTRDQVRTFDADLLEIQREGHISFLESWSLSPDGSGPRVEVTSHHLQSIEFEIPGDLDTRRPTETGLNLMVKASDGRVLAKEAGRSTTTGPLEPEIEPNAFKGRWDFVTLGEDVLIPRFCAALTGT